MDSMLIITDPRIRNLIEEAMRIAIEEDHDFKYYRISRA